MIGQKGANRRGVSRLSEAPAQVSYANQSLFAGSEAGSTALADDGDDADADADAAEDAASV